MELNPVHADGLQRESMSSIDISAPASERKISVVEPLTQLKDETLLDSINSNPTARNFFRYLGCYWPTMEEKHTLKGKLFILYFIVVRIVVIGGALNFLSAIIEEIILNPNLVMAITSVVGFSVLALDAIIVLPAFLFNQNRLLQRCDERESGALESSAKVAGYYLLFCVLTNLIYLSIAFALVSSFPILFVNSFFTGVALSSYLAFNLCFIVIDLKSSLTDIEALIAQAQDGSISMQQFEMVRTNITQRVERSRWPTDLMVVLCILSTIVLVVLFLVSYAYIDIVWCIYFMRQFAFVAIAFWYVAKVNGKADELTQLLSISYEDPARWNAMLMQGQGGTKSREDESEKEDSKLKEDKSYMHHSDHKQPQHLVKPVVLESEQQPNKDKQETVLKEGIRLRPLQNSKQEGEGGEGRVESSLSVSPLSPSFTKHSHYHHNQQVLQEQEMKRLSLCLSAVVRPLTFTMVSQRITWSKVGDFLKQ